MATMTIARPTVKTTILFDATRHRNSTTRFGRGLTAPRPAATAFHPSPSDSAFNVGWTLGRSFTSAAPSSNYSAAESEAFLLGYEQGRMHAADEELSRDARYNAALDAMDAERCAEAPYGYE